jgi:hypothetical protein
MTDPVRYGQYKMTPVDLGALPLSDQVNHIVGTAVTLITKPTWTNGRPSGLVLLSENGGFRVAVGDRTATMPTLETPAATVADNTGTLYLGHGGKIVLPGPDTVTIKGYAADSVLTYYWT